MASVVWMAVFFLLMFELFITAILVLPVPRFIRKFIAKKIFTYNLAKRVRFASNFIILGLILAVSDAITTLRHLEQKEATSDGSTQVGMDGRAGYIGASFDKQRKFRAERNVRWQIFCARLSVLNLQSQEALPLTFVSFFFACCYHKLVQTEC